MLISLVMQHSGPESAPPLTERDISELAAVLPVEAREQLQHMLTVEEKQIAARQWIHAAMLSLFRPPKVSRDELERFFTQLPAETRERLERLPRNRMYDELARRYDMQRRGRDRWRRDHRGRFRPNGPPPPGASPGHGPPDDHDQPHRGPRHGGPAAHPRDPAT